MKKLLSTHATAALCHHCCLNLHFVHTLSFLLSQQGTHMHHIHLLIPNFTFSLSRWAAEVSSESKQSTFSFHLHNTSVSGHNDTDSALSHKQPVDIIIIIMIFCPSGYIPLAWVPVSDSCEQSAWQVWWFAWEETGLSRIPSLDYWLSLPLVTINCICGPSRHWSLLFYRVYQGWGCSLIPLFHQYIWTLFYPASAQKSVHVTQMHMVAPSSALWIMPPSKKWLISVIV